MHMDKAIENTVSEQCIATQTLILKTMTEMADAMRAEGKPAFLNYDIVAAHFCEKHPDIAPEQFAKIFEQLPPNTISRADALIHITSEGRREAQAGMEKLVRHLSKSMFVKGTDGKLALTGRGLDAVRELTRELQGSVELGEEASWEFAQLLNSAQRAGSLMNDMPANGAQWANHMPRGVQFPDKSASASIG